MKYAKGFTLIELVITVVMVLIVGSVVITGIGSMFTGGGEPGSGSKSKNETLASKTTLAKFPESLRHDIEITSAICDTFDSDDNGRVRCTVNYMQAGNTDLSKVMTDTWECPAMFSLNNACVAMKHGTGGGWFGKK